MTNEEILQQMYDNTLVGNRPAVVELTELGIESGLGPRDAVVRGADPGAGGGGRAVRARRLLRARDADRRTGDDGRAGAAAAAARRDRRRDGRHLPDGHGQGRRARHRQEPGRHHARGRRLQRDRPRRAGGARDVHRRDQGAQARRGRLLAPSSPPRCRCSRSTSRRSRRQGCATTSSSWSAARPSPRSTPTSSAPTATPQTASGQPGEPKNSSNNAERSPPPDGAGVGRSA